MFQIVSTLLMFSSVTWAVAANVTIRPGETIDIKSNKPTKVSCEGGTSSENNQEPANSLCDNFFSDDGCESLAVGAPCQVNDQPGICVQKSVMGGKKKCKCAPSSSEK